MAWRFNSPPGWPPMPPGWQPPQGWSPDPAWPPAPPDWQFWVEEPDVMGGYGPQAGPGGAAPSPRRGGPGRVIGIVVVTLVLVGLVAGGIAMLSTLARRTETRDLSTETTSAAVVVDNPCGSITLRPGRVGSVSTRATIRYNWRQPQVTSQREGDAVAVRVDCPAFGLGSSVSLVVDVPPEAAVNASSSAGSVQAQALAGDLVLRSSAGSVSATDLTSRAVDASSSAGSVSLTWAAQSDPNRIEATSSAGSVNVRVPDIAAVAYQVDADSSAGSVTVNVRTDPQSDRTIRARSSAGSVFVGYR